MLLLTRFFSLINSLPLYYLSSFKLSLANIFLLTQRYFDLKISAQSNFLSQSVSRGELTLPESHHIQHVSHGKFGATSQTSQEIPSTGDVTIFRK